MFEIDLPDVLAFKDSVLAARGAAPRCERTTVPADLRAGWATALTKAGFDRSAPAERLAEGLLIYLSAAEAERLLTSISELSAPGSQLSFEHSPMAAAALTGQARQMPLGALVTLARETPPGPIPDQLPARIVHTCSCAGLKTGWLARD